MTSGSFLWKILFGKRRRFCTFSDEEIHYRWGWFHQPTCAIDLVLNFLFTNIITPNFVSILNYYAVPGVNFINIPPAALAPVDLHRSYWHTAQSVWRIHWTYLLVVRISKVGCNFVGETEWYQKMTISSFAICTIKLVKFTPGGSPL